jgi:hypothetical protein
MNECDMVSRNTAPTYLTATFLCIQINICVGICFNEEQGTIIHGQKNEWQIKHTTDVNAFGMTHFPM